MYERSIFLFHPRSIKEGKEGRKGGTNHASGKMGNDEFLAGVRTRFFARRGKHERERNRDKEASRWNRDESRFRVFLATAKKSWKKLNGAAERFSCGGAREFFSRLRIVRLRHEEMRGEARKRERERRPRLSRSHKTNERIPFFSPSRGKGTRRKRRQKENGRQHRFDLTGRMERGGTLSSRDTHSNASNGRDDG